MAHFFLAPTDHMRAALGKVDQAVATMTTLPAGTLPHLLYRFQLPVFRAIRTNGVCIALTPAAGACQAALALDIERVLVINSLARVDKFAAVAVRAVYSCILWRAEMSHRLKKCLLSLAVYRRLNDTAGERLRAASWRHAGLVGTSLADNITQAFGAIRVVAG